LQTQHTYFLRNQEQIRGLFDQQRQEQKQMMMKTRAL
jgi:hypothetical protein